MSSPNVRQIMAGTAIALLCTPVLAENLTPNLQFNGFATVGAAWVDGNHTGSYLDNGLGRSGIDHDASIDYDSVVGLQFSYKANDKVDLTTQLVAKGRTSGDGSTAPWAITADWAYLAYHATDDVTIRGGRFGFNTYMYSENLRVGEAYPWARLPTEVYSSLPLENYDGVDALIKYGFGDWTLTIQPFLGTYHDKNIAVNNMHGINFNMANDALSFHAGSSTSSVNFTLDTSSGTLAALPPSVIPLVNVKHNRASYTDFGVLYDDGEWFAAAEYGQLRNQGWAIDFNSGYASVGHYFGDWLPYALYSRLKSVNNQETIDAFPAPIGEILLPAVRRTQATKAVGVRYQLRPNTSIKAQVDQITGFDGTEGLFSNFTAPASYKDLHTAYLYSLSLNVAF